MIATNDQKVFRVFAPDGSVWKCERNGVSPRMLWKLLANDLIEDEPQTAIITAVPTTIRMRLSKVGRRAEGRNTPEQGRPRLQCSNSMEEFATLPLLC